MKKAKYYKTNACPIGNVKIWLFEMDNDNFIREIGLSKTGSVLFQFPDKDFPRGLFTDSPIYFESHDLIEITKMEFIDKWI